jgi:uncharacterized membrane protein
MGFNSAFNGLKQIEKGIFFYSFFEVRTGERKTVAHKFKTVRKLRH